MINETIALEEVRGPGGSPERLLTLPQAAEFLQVGRCTMQKLVTAGTVQSFKIGRLRRVPQVALEQYVRNLMEGDQ